MKSSETNNWHSLKEEKWNESKAKEPYYGQCIKKSECCNNKKNNAFICNPEYLIETTAEKIMIYADYSDKIFLKTHQIIKKDHPIGKETNIYIYNDVFIFDINNYSGCDNTGFEEGNKKLIPHLNKLSINKKDKIKIIFYTNEKFILPEINQYTKICKTCSLELRCDSCPIHASKQNYETEYNKNILIQTDFTYALESKKKITPINIETSNKLFYKYEYERFFNASQFWIINEETLIENYQYNVDKNAIFSIFSL